GIDRGIPQPGIAATDYAGARSSAVDRARQIQQRDCGGAWPECQHSGRASRQYYADPGHTQHRRTGGVCDSPGSGEYRVNRRTFIGGAFLGGAFLDGGGARALAANPPGLDFRLTDVTAAAGIQFRHNSGAFGAKYLPETM